MFRSSRLRERAAKLQERKQLQALSRESKRAANQVSTTIQGYIFSMAFHAFFMRRPWESINEPKYSLLWYPLYLCRERIKSIFATNKIIFFAASLSIINFLGTWTAFDRQERYCSVDRFSISLFEFWFVRAFEFWWDKDAGRSNGHYSLELMVFTLDGNS